MADMEKKVGVIEAISDDELDAVAGGLKMDEIPVFKQQAAADGRTVRLDMLASGAMCCGIYCVYSREKQTQNGTTYYHDVKCYKCGKTATYYPPLSYSVK